jgi:hypothetical protein
VPSSPSAGPKPTVTVSATTGDSVAIDTSFPALFAALSIDSPAFFADLSQWRMSKTRREDAIIHRTYKWREKIYQHTSAS